MLELRGIHYVATRFGGGAIRRRAFDAKYNSGQWVFDRPDTALNAIVGRYAKGGEILILGCGRAITAAHLEPDCYSRIVGFDLSPAAIAAAEALAIKNASFHVGDMTKEPRDGHYSVVLLPDSIYYVPVRAAELFFEHLRRLLAPGGVVIATIAAPERHRGMVEMIRRHGTIIEQEPDSSLSVFR